MVARAEDERRVSAGARAPDARGMQAAIRAFLAAAGLDPDDPELAETPSRVADAWIEDYLDGYGADPEALLSTVHPAKSKGLVTVTRIDFHSMCPHHLVPYRGVAHLAYLPGQGVAGFGTLVRLLDAFAHRLILQEEIADGVTGALAEHLGARGTACVLDAEQACVTTRGPRRREARTVTSSYTGELASNERLKAEFLRACGLGGATSSRGIARRSAAKRTKRRGARR